MLGAALNTLASSFSAHDANECNSLINPVKILMLFSLWSCLNRGGGFRIFGLVLKHCDTGSNHARARGKQRSLNVFDMTAARNPEDANAEQDQYNCPHLTADAV